MENPACLGALDHTNGGGVSVDRTDMGYTRETIRRALGSLGVELADTLFIHSSFKKLGPVDGGAETIVAAFEDAVGPDGLLLMPVFNLVERPLRRKVWDISTI